MTRLLSGARRDSPPRRDPDAPGLIERAAGAVAAAKTKAAMDTAPIAAAINWALLLVGLIIGLIVAALLALFTGVLG